MRDEDRVAGELEECRKRSGQPRGVGHRGVGDAGQRGDERRDGHAGIDQGRELADHLAALHLHCADLGDTGLCGCTARGLEVDDDEHGLGQ